MGHALGVSVSGTYCTIDYMCKHTHMKSRLHVITFITKAAYIRDDLTSAASAAGCIVVAKTCIIYVQIDW